MAAEPNESNRGSRATVASRSDHACAWRVPRGECPDPLSREGSVGGGEWGEERGATGKGQAGSLWERMRTHSTVAGFPLTADIESGMSEKNSAAKLRVETQAFHLGSTTKDNFRHCGGGTRGHLRPTESRSHSVAQRKGNP